MNLPLRSGSLPPLNRKHTDVLVAGLHFGVQKYSIGLLMKNSMGNHVIKQSYHNYESDDSMNYSQVIEKRVKRAIATLIQEANFHFTSQTKVQNLIVSSIDIFDANFQTAIEAVLKEAENASRILKKRTQNGSKSWFDLLANGAARGTSEFDLFGIVSFDSNLSCVLSDRSKTVPKKQIEPFKIDGFSSLHSLGLRIIEKVAKGTVNKAVDLRSKTNLAGRFQDYFNVHPYLSNSYLLKVDEEKVVNFAEFVLDKYHKLHDTEQRWVAKAIQSTRHCIIRGVLDVAQQYQISKYGEPSAITVVLAGRIGRIANWLRSKKTSEDTPEDFWQNVPDDISQETSSDSSNVTSQGTSKSGQGQNPKRTVRIVIKRFVQYTDQCVIDAFSAMQEVCGGIDFEGKIFHVDEITCIY